MSNENYKSACPLFFTGVGADLPLTQLAAGTSTTTKIVDGYVFGQKKNIVGAMAVFKTQTSTTTNCNILLCKNSTTTIVASCNLSATNTVGKYYAGTVSATDANLNFLATDALIALMGTKAIDASIIDVIVKTQDGEKS